MPIVRPHPAAPLEGAYYFKRLATEPRFEAIVGVEVDVKLDREYVSAYGTGSEVVTATIVAEALDNSAIQTSEVAVTVSPNPGSNLLVGSVSPPTVSGSTYTFTCPITVTKAIEGAVTEALTQISVAAAVTSATGRQGQGFDEFYYAASRPSTPQTLTASQWPKGIRLTWTTPAASTVTAGDAIVNNASLAYYLIRRITSSLTLATARSLITAGSTPDDVTPTNDRVYRVVGNAFVDPEVNATPFYYWLVAVDLFGNISALSNMAGPVSSRGIIDADITQGAVDIARVATLNSVPNALAAATVTATKVGVLNAAFDPTKFRDTTHPTTPTAANTVAWQDLVIVIGGTRYPASPSTGFTSSTTSPVIIYDKSANSVVGIASVDAMASDDLLLGFNVSGVFRPSFTGTVIRGDTIETGTIIADKLDVNKLSAIAADLGTIDAGVILDSATSPRKIIRLDAAARGLAQDAEGRPRIAVPGTGTVTITSGSAVFSDAQGDLAGGDLISASVSGQPYLFTVVSGSGTGFTVTPTSPNVPAGTAFFRYQRASRVIDLAAIEDGVNTAALENRRFISVVKTLADNSLQDRVVITANGDAKFAGELQAIGKMVVSPEVDTTAPAGFMTVKIPSVFYDANVNGDPQPSINAQSVELVSFEAVERGLIKGTGLRIGANFTDSTNYAQLGSYAIAASGGSVVPVTVTASGSSSVTTTGSATAGTFLSMTATSDSLSPGVDYTIKYTLAIDLPKGLQVSGGSPNSAFPNMTVVVVYLERSLDGGTTWTEYSRNGYTSFNSGLYNITYSLGVPVAYNYKGDAPGRYSDADSFFFTPIATTTIAGSGNVSIGSGGAASFQNPQTLAVNDWIRVGSTDYQIVSATSSTAYTVTPTSPTQSNQSFSIYTSEASFTVPATEVYPWPPRFRLRVGGQVVYATYGSNPVYPSVAFALSSAKLAYTYTTGAVQVTRPYSLALHGGYLYIKPQPSAVSPALAGEMVMRSNGSGGADPYYYDGTAWVAFGSGSAGTITVNTTPGVSALSFTGNVSVTTAGGTSTVTVTNPSLSLNDISAPTTAYSFNSQRLTTLADPTQAQDAATKAYVDATRQGLTVKDSVRVATTASITLSGTQTIDGVAVVAGNRVLVKNQGTASQNGVYVVAAGAWTRATDFDANADVAAGAFTFVQEGTDNSDSGWVLTTDGTITVGSTNLSFVQFSGAGQITAGTGMTKTGNTLNVIGTADRITANADSIDIASTYVGQATITTLGTVTAGTWQATQIVDTYLATISTAGKVANSATTATATSTINTIVLRDGSGNFAANQVTLGTYTGTTGGSDKLLIGGDVRASGTIYANDFVLTGGSGSGVGIFLNDLNDVTTTGASNGQILQYNGTLNEWVAVTANFGSQLSIYEENNPALTTNASSIKFVGSSVTATAVGNNVTVTIATPGNVSGPGASTDKAVVRYLGVTGTQIQDSAVTIDDNGVISGNGLVIGTVANPAPASVSAADLTRLGGNLRVGGTIYANDFVLTGGSGSGVGIFLTDLNDVTTAGVTTGQFLKWSGTEWVPGTVVTSVSVQANGGTSYARQALNFVDGTNATVTVTDDGPNSRINIAVSATGAVSSVFGQTGAITSIPYLTLDGVANMDTITLTTTSATANQVIGTLDRTVFRTVKCLVQAARGDGSAFQVSEILLVHDGSVVYITEYGTILSGSSLASFNADISGGNLRLLVTPASASNTVFKVVVTAVTV